MAVWMMSFTIVVAGWWRWHASGGPSPDNCRGWTRGGVWEVVCPDRGGGGQGSTNGQVGGRTLYYGDLDDGRVLCSRRQVAKSVVITVFSLKKGGQARACNGVIVLHKCKSFLFFMNWSCFRISILFQDFILISGFGYRFPCRFSGFQDFNLFSWFQSFFMI